MQRSGTSSTPHPAPRPITGEELARAPRDGRCELVRGTIVRASPTSPRHGRLEGNVYYHLRSFVEPRGLGRVLVGEVGIFTRRGPDSVRGADVLFLSSERAERCMKDQGFLRVPPDLVAEVLSPSDSGSDVSEKVREYLDAGVRVVWVVDPETRSVRVHGSHGGVVIRGLGDTLDGGDVLPGFAVEVERLFEE